MSKVLVDEEKLGKLLKNRLQSVIDVLYANKGQDPKIWREMSERAWPDDTELLKMGMDFLEAKPLTPAQERARDEDEWVVVRKDELEKIIDESASNYALNHKHFQEIVMADWVSLTTPDAENELNDTP
jgi:hypothetical protein